MGTSPAETPKPGGDSGTNDRRVALRRNVVDSHLVTVDLAFQGGALVLDLSETGMGVQALSSAPMGASTSLQFDLPETGGRVDAVGKIAWTDSSGRLGIQFERIAELGRVHLAQWLTSDRRHVVAQGPNVAIPTWPPPYARDEIAALRRDLTTEKLEGDAALAFVVERVRNVTRATGAAIALEDGGVVVCRASSGNAPGIGARLDPNSGLSGECIRTGEIVRCEDTETDPRADRLICRKLELRSIVIVPIRLQGRSAGVLEAFSSGAHAFQAGDVLWLRRITDLVAGIAARQPETALSSITGPQALMAAATLQPLVQEPNPEPETPLMMDNIFVAKESIAPPPAWQVVTTPQPTPRPKEVVAAPPFLPQPRPENAGKAEPGTASVAPPRVAAPAGRPAPRPAVALPAVCPAPPPVQVPVELPAPRPVAMTPVDAPQPSPAAAMPVALSALQEIKPAAALKPETEIPAPRSFAAPPSHDVVTPSPVATAAMRAMGAAAAAARPRPVPVDLEDDDDGDRLGPSSMGDAMLANLPPQIPSRWRLRLTGAGVLAVVLVVGGWQVWRAMAPPQGTPMDNERKESKPVANPPAPGPASSTTAVPSPAAPAIVSPEAKTQPPPVGLAKPGNPPAAAKNVPAQSTPAPAAYVPATTPAPREVAKGEVPEAPPAMGLERPAGPSAISSVLSAPVAAPTLDKPARISEMTGGKLIRRFDPAYPATAAGLHGEVVLKATIDKKGAVSRVKIVSGHALLAQAAANAVRRWRYEPFVLNGVPIEIENTIVVNFRAPGEQR